MRSLPIGSFRTELLSQGSTSQAEIRRSSFCNSDKGPQEIQWLVKQQSFLFKLQKEGCRSSSVLLALVSFSEFCSVLAPREREVSMRPVLLTAENMNTIEPGPIHIM